jgi:signal transduction histidine kinase
MDAWLTRLYQRHRGRYVTGSFVTVVLVMMLIVGPLVAFFPSHYEGLSLAEYARVIALVEVGGAGVLGGALLMLRGQARALLAWVDEPSEERAPAARRAAFDGPRRLALNLGLLALPATPIASAMLLTPRHHTGLLDWIEILIGAVLAVLLATLNAWFDLEVLLRPVRAELGHPPRDSQRSSLTLRLALIVPASTWVACYGVGYLSTTRTRAGPGHLLVLYALSLGGVVVCLVAVAPLLVGGVFAPIRDLTRATRAVAGGRLDVRVPVTATDELGELAMTFDQMLEELRSTRRRIVAASDAARRTVERDLHDGAQQQLVLLGMKLGMMERQAQSDPAAVTAMLPQVRAELQEALRQLRDLAHGIYPQVLESDGLAAALAQVVKRPPLPATLDCDGAGRYPREVETSVYFCCLEALQNAAKHAGPAARVMIRLSEEQGNLKFVVADDGRGFDSVTASTTMGLQNMADRISALGGTLQVSSSPGAGTTVTAYLPVAAR